MPAIDKTTTTVPSPPMLPPRGTAAAGGTTPKAKRSAGATAKSNTGAGASGTADAKPKRERPEVILVWDAARDKALIETVQAAGTSTYTAQGLADRLKAHPAFAGVDSVLNALRVRSRVNKLNEISMERHGVAPLQLNGGRGYNPASVIDELLFGAAQGDGLVGVGADEELEEEEVEYADAEE